MNKDKQPIFPFAAITQLIRDERELHTTEGKFKYITRCFSRLNGYLIDHFNRENNCYLFHRAFYIDDKKFKSIELKDGRQNASVKAAIQFIEGRILRNDITLSFTQLLNDSLKSGVCLYRDPGCNKQPEPGRDFLYFDLETGDQRNLERFLKVPAGGLSGLIQAYNGIKETPVYIYFIRPFTKLPHYNGTFNLILKRQLTEAEFTEIGLLWTKILSDTAMAESKEELENQLFEEYFHSSRTEMIAISQYLNFIGANLEEEAPAAFSANRHFLNAAVIKTQDIRDIIEFNLYLMKSGQGKLDYKDLLKDPSLPKLESICLNKLISDILENMTVVLQGKYIQEPLTGRQINALNVIKEKLNRQHPVEIAGNRTGLSIILTDLLKNALAYAGDPEPQLDVRIVQKGSSTSIHFVNALPIRDDAYQYINQDEFSDTVFLASRYGIRTIKRIINSPLFNNEKQQWLFKVTEQSKNGPTNIYVQLIERS